MERNNGLRSFLQQPWVYETFQRLVAGSPAKRWLLDNHWKIEPGMTVLDIGCGPGNLRSDLPADIKYYGFDPNPDYIASAERDYDGTFLSGVMPDFLREHGAKLNGQVDVVLLSCVLHHLTREQMDEVLIGARQLLKNGGRFAILEPCLLAKQGMLSRWIMSQDRGCNILYDFQWREVLAGVFPECEIKVLTNLIRIPYTHAAMTGWKIE